MFSIMSEEETEEWWWPFFIEPLYREGSISFKSVQTYFKGLFMFVSSKIGLVNANIFATIKLNHAIKKNLTKSNSSSN